MFTIHTWGTRPGSSENTPWQPCCVLSPLPRRPWWAPAPPSASPCSEWTGWGSPRASSSGSTFLSLDPVRRRKWNQQVTCCLFEIFYPSVSNLFNVLVSSHRSACWSASRSWALRCGCSETGSGQCRRHDQRPSWAPSSARFPTRFYTAALGRWEFPQCSVETKIQGRCEMGETFAPNCIWW